MKIDAHHHFWRYQPSEFDWIPPGNTELFRDFLPKEFSNELRSVGFDRSIVVQARQSLAETRWLLGLTELWPCLSGVVVWVDLCSDEVEGQIQEFVRNPKFVGVRHVVHAETEDFLERPSFRRGLGALQNYGLTYDLLIYPQHLSLTRTLAEEFPSQTFVLNHLAKPWIGRLSRNQWKQQVRALSKNPNVYAKLTGLVPEGFPPSWSKQDIGFYLDTAFEAFGEDRLMIGSNWPVCLTVGSYPWILHWVQDYLGSFSGEAREKVLGGNAQAIYGLSLGNTGDSNESSG